jgi:hypothetical protein
MTILLWIVFVYLVFGTIYAIKDGFGYTTEEQIGSGLAFLLNVGACIVVAVAAMML